MSIDVRTISDVIALTLEPPEHHHFPPQQEPGADVTKVVGIRINVIRPIERYLHCGDATAVEGVERFAARGRSGPVIVGFVSCTLCWKRYDDARESSRMTS